MSEADRAAAAWRPPTSPSPSPRNHRAALPTLAVSAFVGIAIWWPTMAMRPRYDYSHSTNQEGSGWYWPLMFAAAAVLTLVFSQHWKYIGPGLVSLQLVVAPFTTPRGDNDGLWILMLPIIVVLGAALTGYCSMLATAIRYWRQRALREQR